jgi:hypothetical protein
MRLINKIKTDIQESPPKVRTLRNLFNDMKINNRNETNNKEFIRNDEL